MKEIKVGQNTPEWDLLRSGKITTSNFDLLMPSSKQKIDKFSKGQITYLLSVAAEIITGLCEDNFQTEAMRTGHEREPFALEALSKELNAPIRNSGFWEHSNYVGSSPDGIGGFSEFTVEVKCPQPKNHLLYLYDIKEFEKKYEWQFKGQMWCTKIENCYYGSYNPDFPIRNQLTYSGCDLTDSDKDLLDNRMGYAVKFIKRLITEDPIEVNFK